MADPITPNDRSDQTTPRRAVRFAPSPNGRLHLGHAFSALFSVEIAKALGARFLLRIEDIDTARSRPEYIAGIEDDLAWLGLTWETPVRRQSEHMDDYRAGLDRLAARSLIYPSFATRSEIAAEIAAREAGGTSWPRDPDGAPHYPGLGKRLSAAEASARWAAGESAALRLDMDKAIAAAGDDLSFREIGPVHGAAAPIAARPSKWGDVVLARKDIGTSYHLSVVIDDALQGVTHVTRGTDLYEATHLHRLLQALLGLPVPVWCHHPLIMDAEGRKLAKSAASRSLASLRADGATPADIHEAVGIERHRRYFERVAAAG